MEHLLVASRPVLLKIEVPYVCQETYQLGSFHLYPLYRGYRLSSAGYLVIRNDQRRDLGSLLQEWLYFGLLEEILRRNMTVGLTKSNTGETWKVIDTSVLPDYLREFRSYLLALTKDERDMTCRDINKLLTFASIQCCSIDRDHVWSRQNYLPEILLSIRLLIDTLVMTMAEFDEVIDLSTKQHRFPLYQETGNTPPSTSILLDHMVKNSWCIHQARFFCHRFSYSVILYLSSIPRKATARGHQECEDGDHCVANNTNAKTYQCRHVENGCRCELLPTSSEEVKSIIRDGGIPLVAFSHDHSGKIQQRIVKAMYSTKYTAISHVWSDGLGNPNENALPKCQIEKLVRQVKKADAEKRKREPRKPHFGFRSKNYGNTPVLIWMDTLCIPVSDAALKMKAINRMTPIYKRAARVLVLDSTLDLEMPPGNPMEICAHLLMSAWNGRSWALQEGALATELLFPVHECQDRTYNPFIWDSAMAKYTYAELHKAHQLPSVGHWRGDGVLNARESQFLGVWNALLGRTTTMNRDVHGILANLLDFHAEEILLLHERNRMKALLCGQERLPIQILYDSNSKEFADSPLDRWIPDFPKGRPISKQDTWMNVTNRGLVIAGTDVCERSIVVRHEEGSQWLNKYRVVVDGIGRFGVTMHTAKSSSPGRSEGSVSLLHLETDVASILNSGNSAIGAAFTVVEDDKFGLKVVFDCPVTVDAWTEVEEDEDFEKCPNICGVVISKPQDIVMDIDVQGAYKPRFRREPHQAMRSDKIAKRWMVIVFFCWVFFSCVLFSAIGAYGTIKYQDNEDAETAYFAAMWGGLTINLIGCLLSYVVFGLVRGIVRERRYQAYMRSFDELNPRIRRQLSWG